jgi:hypothetical protein
VDKLKAKKLRSSTWPASQAHMLGLFFFFIGRMIVHLIKTKTKKTKKKNKIDKMSPAMVDEALST